MGIVAPVLAAEAAAETSGGLAGVVQTLGLNVPLFLAQLLNFGLLVVVLWRLLYRPLVRFMEERSARIAQGLERATAYEQKLQALEVERQAVRRQAEQDAQRRLAAADDEAAKILVAARQEAGAAAAAERSRVERELEQTRREMLAEVRASAADLVVLAAEKVIRERLTDPADRKLAEQALRESS